jgi:methyl-accepting chemotaxis protein
MDSITNFFSNQNLIEWFTIVNNNGIWVLTALFILFVIDKFGSLYRTKKTKEMDDKLSRIINNADTYKNLHKKNMEAYEQNEKFLGLLSNETKTLVACINEAIELYNALHKDAEETMNKVNSLKVELSGTIGQLEQTRQNYENLNGINEIIKPINDINSKVAQTYDHINRINTSTKNLANKVEKDVVYIQGVQENTIGEFKSYISINRRKMKNIQKMKAEINNG